MGVPSFYKWLIEKYPKITSKFFQAPVGNSTTTFVPGVIYSFNNVATNQVFACDNLYIDMNGIVHNSTHVKAQTKEEFEAIVRDNLFYALDRIIFAANPQKLIYLALDGVPPRAKAAEQRQRRYKTALTMRKAAANPKPTDVKQYSFDSNEISPGTKFMQYMHESLNTYLELRLKSGGSWANLHVVLSDTRVPGEGEHKIMDYIRSLIAQKDYDENTHHMFYGLDADLVFLGLATTAKYFTVLRDNHVYIYCNDCGLPEHATYECDKRTPIGNLVVISRIPPQTDPQLLLDLFKTCGEIRRHHVGYTPTRPGVLFIDFIDQEAAVSALQGGWMINGVSLTVSKPEFDIFSLGTVITVTQMPLDTTEAKISEWFSQFGHIKRLWAPSKRSYYIEYDNEESAKMAVNFKWPADCNLLVRVATERHARTPVSRYTASRRAKVKKGKPSGEKAEGNPAEEAHKEADKGDAEKADEVEDETSEETDTDATDEEQEQEQEPANEHQAGERSAAEQAVSEQAKKELEDEKKVWRFELTQLHTLCDYFQHEFSGKPPKQFIPDFVLFSAFVGNDFVRPLPNFVIMNGGMDLLFSIYKHMAPTFSLVKDGQIQLDNLIVFMEEMVAFEKSTFVKKKLPMSRNTTDTTNINTTSTENNGNNNNNGETPVSYKPRYRPRDRQSRNRQYKPRAPATASNATDAPAPASGQPATENATDPSDTPAVAALPDSVPVPEATPTAPAMHQHKPAPKPFQPRPPRVFNMAKAYEEWRVRYYKNKLHIDITTDTESVNKVCKCYLDTLVWVLRYYFSGTPSWSWFYPYHYAPVTCDLLAYLKTIVQSGHTTTEFIKFPVSEPIKPLYHLMSILPVESVNCVPSAYQPLMTESTSPIADVYPTTFKIDSNGARMSSHSVVLVDFVNTAHLLEHLALLDSSLSAEEQSRNCFGTDKVLTKPSTSTNTYKIEKSILSPKDVHWVSRRSGFMLPKESAPKDAAPKEATLKDTPNQQ